VNGPGIFMNLAIHHEVRQQGKRDSQLATARYRYVVQYFMEQRGGKSYYVLCCLAGGGGRP
jgi:hypothetical protein